MNGHGWLILTAVCLMMLWWTHKHKKEGFSRVATADDLQMAQTGFFKKKCLEGGHSWNISADGQSWDCKYSQESCNKNSAYPELTAEESSDGIPRSYLYWDSKDNKCYMGYSAFRKKCEELGLKWDHDKQQCRVTPDYCKSKLLMYKEGDCFDNPISEINEKIFGKTIGRAMAMAGISGLINAANWGEQGIL